VQEDDLAMAKIMAQCPNPDCGAAGYVEEKYAGKQVKCKTCGTTFTVPALEVSSAEDEPRHVFVSYSHEDSRWFEEDSLIPWLARSLRRDNVEIWYDRQGLQAGDDFRRRIEEEIDTADLALVMISQGFLTSEFIEEVELPRIRGRAARGELAVIPVLVEPCEWEQIAFIASLQMLPGEPTPLIDYIESDREWAHVRFEILQAIKSRLQRGEGAPVAATQVNACWAGMSVAGLMLQWRPREEVDETSKPVFRSLFGILDGCLQAFDLPFPLTGTWPDQERMGAAGGQVQEAFTSMHPSLSRAYNLGFALEGFNNLSYSVFKNDNAATRAHNWANAEEMARHAHSHASDLGLSPSLLQEISDLAKMPMPDYGPDIDPVFMADAAELRDRVVQELSPSGAAGTEPASPAVDRVTDWFDGSFSPSPEPHPGQATSPG